MQDLVEQAREFKLWRGSLDALAAALPAGDAAVESLLTDLVAAKDNEPFTRLLLAALHGGRVVDARLLVEGAALLPDPGVLTMVAWKLSGDVAQALVQAVERGAMGAERETVALVLAAGWCVERDRKAGLAAVAAQSRALARNPFLEHDRAVVLLAIALLTDDEGLKTVLSRFDRPEARSLARFVVESVQAQARRPIAEQLPQEPPPTTLSGYTVRRAVPRLGRNDPCHCGSGKKYKRCCYDQDHVRLAQSSSVAGLTQAELRSQIEEHLTFEELRKMRSYELARLDAAKVAPGLLPLLINRLLMFNDIEGVVRLFEAVGVQEPIAEHWQDALSHAANHRQTAALQQLIRLRPGFDLGGAEVSLDVRLALASELANPALDLLETEARAVLECRPGHENTSEIGYALLTSRYPALGILIARGIVPIIRGLDHEMLYDVLLETRDRLNLDFRDPIDPVIELCAGIEPEHQAEESAALAQARKNIEEKSAEVRRVRQELDRLKSELGRLVPAPTPVSGPPAALMPAPAAAPAPDSPAAVPAPGRTSQPGAASPDHDSETAALRRRIEDLRVDLNQRHTERNQLRRELQKVTQDLETMRARTAQRSAPAAPEPADGEGSLFREAEFESHQPVRIPEYGKRFTDALGALPVAIARTAMMMVGRLAAGQPAAFTGIKKLEANPQILRQRVGGDYRLLFRLTPAALQALALVHRRDLDRQIRNLFTAS
jgi:hypothetical protein